MRNTQIFFSSIWLIHFEASIDLSYCWNVIRDKWLQFSIEIYLLWLVSLNVFEKIFHILRNLKISVLGRVVCARYIFILIAILIIVGPWFLCLWHSLLLLLLSDWRSLILCASTNIIHIDLIIFFI